MAIAKRDIKRLVDQIIDRRCAEGLLALEVREKALGDRIYQDNYGQYLEAMNGLPDWMFIRVEALRVRVRAEGDLHKRGWPLKMSTFRRLADRHNWAEVEELHDNDDRAVEFRAIVDERVKIADSKAEAHRVLMELIGNCKSVKAIKDRWPGIVDEAKDLVDKLEEAEGTPNLPAVRNEDLAAMLDKIGQKKVA